jgi:hypothetical protein
MMLAIDWRDVGAGDGRVGLGLFFENLISSGSLRISLP